MATDDRLDELSDEEIISIAYRLIRMEGTEEEEETWAQILKDAVPGMMNLLFRDSRTLSPEEALEEARKRKPIQLGPGQS